mmetsp:Transcript_16621/g.28327  ORF Transcript_16621/g.28327 Transcript_16621/m.28327 type:complete len:190 (+) Transcript_16621:831-1400(+)
MVQFFANLFINIDMGILPAASVKVKGENRMENSQFGALGSVVYFGQTLGSAIATGMLHKVNAKPVLGICLFLNIGSLLLFTVTRHYPVLVLCRTLTGLFQVFFCIYFPVWADIFGNEKQQSAWLTYLLIASPLGVILGYGMTAILLENWGWRASFYIQSALLTPCFIGILLTPSKYINIALSGRQIKAF